MDGEDADLPRAGEQVTGSVGLWPSVCEWRMDGEDAVLPRAGAHVTGSVGLWPSVFIGMDGGTPTFPERGRRPSQR